MLDDELGVLDDELGILDSRGRRASYLYTIRPD
jgi:hypothetical protein